MKRSKISFGMLLVTLLFQPTLSLADDSINLQGFDPVRGGVTVSADAQKVTLSSKDSESLLRNSTDPVVGNANGSVTLVEFLDYQCKHCVATFPTIQAILRKNANLRIVYKELPVKGPASVSAAKAVLAAQRQGKFAEFHKALMRAGNMSDSALINIAKSLGLDVEKFKTDMESAEISNEIAANRQLAENLGLTGTPSFFISRTDSGNPTYLLQGEIAQAYMQSIINKVNH